MLSTKTEIEHSLRVNLPVFFGDVELVQAKAFGEKYNALVEYAIAVSAPFLGIETVRYQSMVMYLTLLLLAGKIFQIDKFKIGEHPITVDRTVFVMYGGLIAAIAVVFAMKAYVDYQRARLTQIRNVQALIDVSDLLSKGRLSSLIEYYFWNEIFDAIGSTYKAYDDALKVASGGQPNFTHFSVQTINLDHAALSSDPDLKWKIDTLSRWMIDLRANLTRDEEQFKREAEAILSRGNPRGTDPTDGLSWYERHKEIEAAFDRTLQKWLEARNELASTGLKSQIAGITGPDSDRVHAVEALAKSLVKIRRVYAALEVFTPLLFVIASLVYVLLR